MSSSSTSRNEQPVRDPATGFCIECAPGEAGERSGRIDAGDPIMRFDGYFEEFRHRKKLLRDVFEKGDLFRRTGDLLRRDAEGYFYFVDRIGDTFPLEGRERRHFRVAEAMSVYPGTQGSQCLWREGYDLDGRAGMAAVVAGPDL